MDIIVTVDGEFGVSAAEFVQMWNLSADHSAIAAARPMDDNRGVTYEPISVALVVLGSLATGVASNALYALLGTLLNPKSGGREIRYRRVEQSDGTTVVEIRLTEPE